MLNTPLDFPTPVKINGRLFFEDLSVENYKRSILGLPPLGRDDTARTTLIPAKKVAAEFGFGRRTLGRRIKGRVQDESALDAAAA
jgi:hypothetical protein